MTVGQLAFDAMPQPLFACTPNRLAGFACPRRYRFTYLDDPSPPRGVPWARSTIGAVAHVALYRWWLLPRAHRTPDEGASLVERNWRDGALGGFRDAAQSLRACVATAGWVRDYLCHVDPRDEPVGVERAVAARTRTLTVSGRVDRIDERDEQVVVVDYKTGRRAPTEQTRPGRRRWRSTSWVRDAPCVASAGASSCTTCRRARSQPSSTPTPRCTTTSREPRAPLPASWLLPPLSSPVPIPTSRSRRGRPGPARGATSAGTAPRGRLCRTMSRRGPDCATT